MPYSVPYIIFLIFVLLIFYLQNSVSLTVGAVRILNITVPLSFLLFFGFRGFIGWDWNLYYPFYIRLDNIFNVQLNVQPFDVGFVIFASIIKTFTSNYHYFIFLNSLIDVVLIHVFFKRYLPEKYYVLGYAVFFVFFGFILETDLLRNAKSFLLFLFSLKFIENRCFAKYFLINLIGFFFHWTSLFFFPLYFFLHKRIALKWLLLIIIFGNIIFLFKIEYITPLIIHISTFFGGNIETKAHFYITSEMFSKNFLISFGYFERLFTSFLFIVYYNRIFALNRSNVLFLNSFIIYITILLFCSEIAIVINRLAALFIFSYWILWPYLISIANRRTKYFLILMFSVIIVLKINVLSGNVLYNYDNYLFSNIQTFKERKVIFNTVYDKLQK